MTLLSVLAFASVLVGCSPLESNVDGGCLCLRQASAVFITGKTGAQTFPVHIPIRVLSQATSEPQESPRRRTLLANGSIAFVERMAGPTVSVQLLLASRDAPETHGYRHLLEHLLLNRKGLDQRLESKGMAITGRTYREVIQFELFCAPGQVEIALEALAEVVGPRTFTLEEVAKEAGIMRHEQAIVPDSLRLGRAAWQKAYGEGRRDNATGTLNTATGKLNNFALDPAGDPNIIAKASPDQLAEVQKQLIHPEKMVLLVCGDVDLTGTTEQLSGFLEKFRGPMLPKVKETKPQEGTPGRTEAPGAFGECRAAIVPAYSEKLTASSISAALAIASRFPGAFVTYTPTVGNGLVLLGRTDEPSGIGLYVDELTDDDIASLYGLGKSLGEAWIKRQLSAPSSNGWLRGLLFASGAGYRVDLLTENLQNLELAEFQQGVKAFGRDKAVVVAGAR